LGSVAGGHHYGKTLAAALAAAVPVNHLEGMCALCFWKRSKGQEPRLPAVCLIVSVAHAFV